MFSAKFCYIGVWIPLICLIQHASGAWLRCYKGSLQNYLVNQLDAPLAESFTSCLDPTVPTIVYTFGYRGKVAGPATTAVLKAYIEKKKRNVVLLDWQDEAQSGLFGISLGYAFHAVPKAKRIGKELGEALMRLREVGVNMTNIHLVGHSLGAHIMGFAGRRTREAGHVVERITGLDPARALFDGAFAVQNGLDRTCAKLVDIVHSDPGGYGTSSSTGTVDIWPNYGTTGTAQPGCPIGTFDMFSSEDLCSHDRAWRYYVEAIASPTAFPAGAASDYDAWLNNDGETDMTIYLGDLTSMRARGNYYLNTNPSPPYGKGVDGLRPNKTYPRERENSTLTKFLTYLS